CRRASPPARSKRRSTPRGGSFESRIPTATASWYRTHRAKRSIAMSRSSRLAFLALVLAQAAHSIEEYRTRLYDVFPPARFVSGLVSADRRVGFIIFNVSLVAFGVWCFVGPIRGARPSARALAWAWAALEVANGLGHMAWALAAGGYRPGLASAPFLVAIGLTLAALLRAPA